MQKTTLRKRDLYLNRIIAFQDTEMIKVMTGIRRCGKSSLMKLMVEHLRDIGETECILYSVLGNFCVFSQKIVVKFIKQDF